MNSIIDCLKDILLSSFYFSIGIFIVYLIKFIYHVKFCNIEKEEAFHISKKGFISDMLHMWIPGAIVSAVVKHL